VVNVRSSLQGTKVKTGLPGGRVLLVLIVLTIETTAAVSAGPDAKSALPSVRITVADAVAFIDKTSRKYGLYKQGFAQVKVVRAPSEGRWTRAACMDPFNRNCVSFLVSACVRYAYFTVHIRIAHRQGRRFRLRVLARQEHRQLLPSD
jgi:hypothetical protein